MFALAILIGIYSYILFSLGVIGILYKNIIVLVTLIYLLLATFYLRNNIRKVNLSLFKKHKFLSGLIVIQILINLIGVLGPELSFDALWYHLTLPKIFLESHRIFHIPGSLFYYSDMPKLTEMLYLLPISIIGEIGAKIIHLCFGILTLIALYKLSRKIMDQKFSLVSSLIFYGSLVVGWQSTTAYIDLSRTFFEVMALWGFINWIEIKNNSKAKRLWLVESAVMIGLAISSKLLSIESLIVYFILLVYISKKINFYLVKNIFIFFLISLFIVSPWLFFSLLNTGNPFYPFFTEYFKNTFDLALNPFIIIKTFWEFFTHSSDPISPLYIILIPFACILFKKLNIQIKIIFLFSLLSLFFWYFTPAKDSRYALPSLAGFSIVCSYVISYLSRNGFLKNFIFTVFVSVSLVSIMYRGVANAKYISVILGKESRDQFLASNLNFNFGDFYDTDGYFKKNIKNSDKVLLYGFHNLYYVDFPFIDSSYVKKGDKFNYIAIQNGKLPERFRFWKIIYFNSKTHVKLYALGGQEWIY